MGRSFRHLDKSLELLPPAFPNALPRYRKLKGPNGRNRCRRCGNEVPPRRESYCSSDCADAWNLTTNQGYIRAQIADRDTGVCAACHLDTRTCPGSRWAEPSEARRAWLRAHGYPEWHRGALWEAHHIVAVVDGGHDAGLDNIQTLCWPCHKRQTADLAARRAQDRKSIALDEHAA